jgi:hypothetical protein
MALTFSTNLSETILLNAYVNNIVEFSSNNPSEAFKCVISIEGNTFEITPNQNEFYFNFKSIFKSLIQDFFEDAVEVALDSQDPTTFIKDLSQITREITIDYAVSFVDGSQENTQRTVTLLQSTSNFVDRKKQEILVLDTFAVLSRLEPASNRTFVMTYFAGYPFDVQVYKKTPGNVVVTNKTNLIDYTFALPYKVNRIFFGDAETDSTIEDVLPLIEGQNQLEFDTGDLTTIYLQKKSGLCGVYLKWKNDFGGWSYWLFEQKYQIERETDDLGYINNDYQNLDNNNFIKNIGKRSQDTWRIGSVNVDSRYRNFILSILDSPKVYLFLGKEFSRDETTDWLAVKLATDSLIVTPYKDRPMDINFALELPERNTLTL